MKINEALQELITQIATEVKHEVVHFMFELNKPKPPVEVKFKKLLPDAVIPFKAHESDAGMDMTATSMEYHHHLKQITFGTGISMEIPPGHAGFLFPRSSVTASGLMLGNSVGIIDSGYRGEIIFKFNVIEYGTRDYKIGDKVGQIIILPLLDIKVSESVELSESIRNIGGFGSSGA